MLAGVDFKPANPYANPTLPPLASMTSSLASRKTFKIATWLRIIGNKKVRFLEMTGLTNLVQTETELQARTGAHTVWMVSKAPRMDHRVPNVQAMNWHLF